MGYQTIYIKPDWRQFVIDQLPSIIFAVVMFIVGGMDIPFSSIFFCVALAFTFHAYYNYIYLRGMEYTITDQQLIYEHGVFTRNRDFVELYRIVDYDERGTFMQQLIGLKTISIYSGDRSTPKLDIIGVKEKSDLIDVLRERVSYNRSRMNIHEFANYV